MRFLNREEAGRRLADVIVSRAQLASPIVFALPRGGVPVAAKIAQSLRVPLDIILVRKIGAPGRPELGIGAVVDGTPPTARLDDELVKYVGASGEFVTAETRRQIEEINRQRQLYRIGNSPVSLAGREIVLVDDGIATGGTVRVSIEAVRARGASFILLAVPVAPAEVIERLSQFANEIICLHAPEDFQAVSQYYQSFPQVSDAEVIATLEKCRNVAPGA